jgi:hypothetical protein
MRIQTPIVVIVIAVSLFLTGCGTDTYKNTIGKWFSGDEEPKLRLRRLSLYDFEDKLFGGWAGQFIGVSYATPYKFKYQGEIMEDPIRMWDEDYLSTIYEEENIIVQLSYLAILEKKGISVTSKEVASFLPGTDYTLTGANDEARKNIQAGVLPPDSGHPKYNRYANNSDFQAQTAVFGLICPGMPITASDIASSYGALTSFGDGLYGGIFVTAMYSAAYFENSRVEMIEKGLLCIPEKSQYHQLIGEVIEYHKTNPTNWKGCWQMLEDKWASADLGPEGYENPYNNDAKFNGGYVVLALLYGDGNFSKTLEIAIRCGQNCDVNASIACGLLGTLQGYGRITPVEYKIGLPLQLNEKFKDTPYNLTYLLQKNKELAEFIIKRNGGKIQRLGDRDYYSVPTQRYKPPRQFNEYTKSMRDSYKANWDNWAVTRKQKRDELLQKTFAQWSKGWTISQWNPESNPGLRTQYEGMFNVFVSHPQDDETPCLLTWTGKVPETNPRLRVLVASSNKDYRSSWILRVRINGNEIDKKTIAYKDGRIDWQELSYSLDEYAGTEISIELENASNDSPYNTAYWGKVEILP